MNKEIRPTQRIPEAQTLIDNVIKATEEGGFGKDEAGYGHAVRNLAQSVSQDSLLGISRRRTEKYL